MGGVVDHPFRLSDGMNRAMISLTLAFALGRFIAVGLVNGVRLLKSGKLPQERFMDLF